MEEESANCQVCGRYIPPADFEKQRAVVLLKKRYCRVCTNAITKGASASTATSSVFLFANQIGALFTRGAKKQ